MLVIAVIYSNTLISRRCRSGWFKQAVVWWRLWVNIRERKVVGPPQQAGRAPNKECEQREKRLSWSCGVWHLPLPSSAPPKTRTEVPGRPAWRLRAARRAELPARPPADQLLPNKRLCGCVNLSAANTDITHTCHSPSSELWMHLCTNHTIHSCTCSSKHSCTGLRQLVLGLVSFEFWYHKRLKVCLHAACEHTLIQEIWKVPLICRAYTHTHFISFCSNHSPFPITDDDSSPSWDY